MIRGGDRGAVAVLTAVLAVVLFGIAALVVDLGVARDSRRQAQNTADAAALAAANALYATQAPNLNQPGDFEAAVEAAKSYAAKNYGTTETEWASCSIPSSEALDYEFPSTGTNCITFNSYLYPRQVLVVVPPRLQGVFFGGVFGYEGLTTGALAQAQLDPGGQRLCTFCVLGDGPHDLQNGNVSVTGGNIWFNGDVDGTAQGTVTSSRGTVIGDDGSTFEDGGNTYVSGAIKNSTKYPGGQAGQPRVVDPLAAEELPFALQDSLTDHGSADPCTSGLGPGIYEGLRKTGGICTLDPGLYVFTGDVTLSGNAGLVADGVTMYLTCATSSGDYRACEPGDTGAGLELSGNGGYQLSPPLKSTHPEVDPEIYGYSVVFDRYNEATMLAVGNGDSFVEGTIYGFNATIDIRGMGGSAVDLSSWVVVKTVHFSGSNAALTVDFDASKNRNPSEGARGLVR